jgi:hypothetical protein
VLVAMIVAFLLHEATALWDVNFATSMRTAFPIEQHVLSLLEVMLLPVLTSVAVLH